MKRYLIQIRGPLPADIAQRIARLHAFAIAEADRYRTAGVRSQATDSQSPKNRDEPTKTPGMPADLE